MKKISSAFLAFIFSISAMAAPAQEKAVVLNPATLRKMVLERNVSVAIAMNQVHIAKEKVNVERANLLPSINLGGVISGGVSFMLTAVSFLLPFLSPSNWTDLRESQHMLTAEGSSFYISQLNTVSSAYALYMTVLGDVQLRAALFRQYTNLAEIEEALRLPAELGMIRKEEYLQAQAQAQLASAQVSQVDDLINKEKAAIRQMLALDLDTEITFEVADVPASVEENKSAKELLETVRDRSPEFRQIVSLILAAQAGRWSKGFSVFNGSTLGKNRAGESWSSFEQTGSFNFGFAYFPTLRISDLNIEQLRLRREELKLDQAELLESTLGSLKYSQAQYDAADKAYKNLLAVYESEYLRYKLGMTDILHVLQASNSLTAAITGKAKAQTALNTLRVSLHRVLLTDEFANIGKCDIAESKARGFLDRIGRIFNPKKYQYTLDELCGG